MTIPKDFAMPEGLSDLGQKAWFAIVALLAANQATHSGLGENGNVFYSPAEWKARGEVYGRESLLIVTHDGGDHAAYFDYDRAQYELIERMNLALKEAGVWFECCTCWYAAIYPL